ncbi:MAG: glycosyltransferase [Lachnospiraceae bacterium]|nr:glycosyltransferase [Lachnospiraceae bacterium]
MRKNGKYVHGNTVMAHIRNAGIFVLPSKSNGMPNALMEAMALGLLCVVTDCPSGGPAKLIRDHENGLLVQNDNPEELADAIIKLLENPGLADSLGENARKITEKYSVEEICTEWRTYICRVVNGED